MTRLAAVMTVLLAHLGFVVPHEAPESPPMAAVASGEFLHRDHVRTRWSKEGEPEYARDCSGCHQYKL